MQKGMHFLLDLHISSGSDSLQAVYEESHGVCRFTELLSSRA